VVGRARRRAGDAQPEPEAATVPVGAGAAMPGGLAGPERRYVLRERLASIGDDFWVENAAGVRLFSVDGKALRMRDTLKFREAGGATRYEIQERALRARDSMAIERDGRTVAEVRKAAVTPLRQRFTVDLAGRDGWQTTGDILQHEYRIEDRAGPVAEISRRWLRVRDTYTVEVAPGRDDLLVIAVAVAIDAMANPQ